MLGTTSSTTQFAIVTDSACDLSFPVLKNMGVAVVPLLIRFAGKEWRDSIDLNPVDFYVQLTSVKGQVATFCASREEYVSAYSDLVEQGYKEIVALFSSSTMNDSYEMGLEAAKDVKGARIQVIDTKCASGELALPLLRLVLDRNAGLGPDEAVDRAVEAARASRLLLIPSNEAPARESSRLAGKKGFLARFNFLRAKALGVRHLFNLNERGVLENLGASPDLSRLAGRMARLMSTYSQMEGALSYVEISSGVPRMLATIEKPLDTNEFEKSRVAVLNTNPVNTARLGIGAVGVAYIPASLLPANEAAALLKS